MINWLELLRFAVRELAISPVEFWKMTLVELMAIAQIDETNIDKNDIKELMQKFPD